MGSAVRMRILDLALGRTDPDDTAPSGRRVQKRQTCDGVGRNPVQPVFEGFLVPVARKRLVDLEEDLLGDVFRQAELAEGAEGDVDHQPVMTDHELTEGLLVARRAAIDQPAFFGVPLDRGSIVGPGHLPTV